MRTAKSVLAAVGIVAIATTVTSWLRRDGANFGAGIGNLHRPHDPAVREATTRVPRETKPEPGIDTNDSHRAGSFDEFPRRDDSERAIIATRSDSRDASNEARKTGSETPQAAADALSWYLRGGDVRRAASLLAFEPEDQARLEALIDTLPEKVREQYGSAASFAAFVMAGIPDAPARTRFLDETRIDDNFPPLKARLRFQNSEAGIDVIDFKHEADGWKQMMSASTVNRLITYIKRQ